MLNVGTKEESELTRTNSGVVLPNGWSRDGRSVVVTLDRRRLPDEAKGMAIGLLPVAAAPNAESQITIITTSARDLWQPSLSPDGRWLAFRVGTPPILGRSQSSDRRTGSGPSLRTSGAGDTWRVTAQRPGTNPAGRWMGGCCITRPRVAG